MSKDGDCRKEKKSTFSNQGSGSVLGRWKLPRGDEGADEGDTNLLEIGMVCMTADPRCLDFYEQDEGADVVLNMREIRGALAFMSEQAHKEDSIYKTPEWLSTAQMGWALGEESMEVDASDTKTGGKVPSTKSVRIHQGKLGG